MDSRLYLRFLTLFCLLTTGAWAQMPAEKPGATNTGPKVPRETLTPSGSITVSKAGTVIENLFISGRISIKASNVTVRNCVIDGGGTLYIIQPSSESHTGTLIENCEIRNAKSSHIIGSNMTIRRCNIWDSGGDLIKPKLNCVIEQNWLHHTGSAQGAHGDGVQMTGGGNVLIRWNHFDLPYDTPVYANSQCIIGGTQNGELDGVTVTENWINGGGMSVNIGSKEGFPIPKNIVITKNLFGRKYQFKCITGKPTFIACNRWEDNGQFLPDSVMTGPQVTEGCDPAVRPAPPRGLHIK